jgi:hypothetical protein
VPALLVTCCCLIGKLYLLIEAGIIRGVCDDGSVAFLPPWLSALIEPTVGAAGQHRILLLVVRVLFQLLVSFCFGSSDPPRNGSDRPAVLDFAFPVLDQTIPDM